MTIIITELLKAQQSIATAVYHGCTKMDAADEKELRYILKKIPAIIGRLEAKARLRDEEVTNCPIEDRPQVQA